MIVPLMKYQRVTGLIFFFILATGILVRLWGINFGLPYVYHPDEPTNMNVYLGILKEQNLNPHFFSYPSLFLYLNSLVSLIYYLVGVWIGKFHAISDLPSPKMIGMGVGIAPLPSFFIVGRLLTVLVGVLALLVVFWVGKSHKNQSAVGLVAMTFMAISPITIVNNHYITPDSFITTFALLTLIGALRLYETGNASAYIFSGIAAGLTISTKYNGVIIILPVIVAHFLRKGRSGLIDWRIYLAGGVTLATFLITTPYAILASQEFLNGIRYESQHYAIGHPGMEGNAFFWYLDLLWKNDGILPVLGLAGLLYGILRRDSWAMIIGSFPVAYFLFVSTYVVRNDRTILVILPFLYLLAANLLTQLWSSQAPRIRQPVLKAGLAALILIGCIIRPGLNTLSSGLYFTRVDSRVTAIDWIRNNIPEGTKVAFEAYAPYIDPQEYRVSYFTALKDQPASWYIDNQFEYLVFSEGMFKRYTEFPAQYPEQAAQYQALFDRFQLVKQFMDGGYVILIYRVN